jgi:hypothetical protein
VLPALFVQVVDVLGDDAHLELISPSSASAIVPRVGLGVQQLSSPLVVKLLYQFRVRGEPLGGGNLLHRGAASHSPPESRKVAIPLSALMPAPVNTTSFFFI